MDVRMSDAVACCQNGCAPVEPRRMAPPGSRTRLTSTNVQKSSVDVKRPPTRHILSRQCSKAPKNLLPRHARTKTHAVYSFVITVSQQNTNNHARSKSMCTCMRVVKPQLIHLRAPQ